jgi:AcrR family transcriptional regulator
MTKVKAKSYHHGNLDQALLDAGLKEAKMTGTRNLGVNSLAKDVDVSPMAVYRHFSSGEALRANISQAAREVLAKRMLVDLGDATGARERFRATGRSYIQFALDEPGLFAAAFVTCDAPPRREDEPSAWIIFQDSILDLCNKGLLEVTEVEQVAAFAWSSVHGYATLAVGNDPKRPKTSQKIIDDLLDRIWAGIVHEKEGLTN